jgi:two-component system, NtrC family, response regulator HydG
MTRRVLVVDDDRQMVKTIRAILDHRGWESIPAYSGEEAVAAATDGPAFGAVLMDVRMPGMNGVEACLKMHDAHPDMPVILMTAYAAQEILAQARRAGVVTIMPKPLAWPKLMAHLDRLSHAAR